MILFIRNIYSRPGSVNKLGNKPFSTWRLLGSTFAMSVKIWLRGKGCRTATASMIVFELTNRATGCLKLTCVHSRLGEGEVWMREWFSQILVRGGRRLGCEDGGDFVCPSGLMRDERCTESCEYFFLWIEIEVYMKSGGVHTHVHTRDRWKQRSCNINTPPT